MSLLKLGDNYWAHEETDLSEGDNLVVSVQESALKESETMRVSLCNNSIHVAHFITS